MFSFQKFKKRFLLPAYSSFPCINRKQKLITILFLTGWSFTLAGNLEKGFVRLHIYDYFKAKYYFEKSLRKKTPGAAYGLSIIYSLNNNPFYNLDSARFYILLSDSAFKQLEVKNILQYKELGITSASIQAQKDSICDRAFKASAEISSLEKYNRYISDFAFCSKAAAAIELRNAEAFREAQTINTSASFKSFIDKYPAAREYSDAVNHYQERLYEETTRDKKIASYEKFLQLYPDNPYSVQAEKMIYSLSTPQKTIEQYHSFIKKYPGNTNVNEAWREIFKLYMKNYNEQVYDRFKIEFPDYPFKDELEKYYKLQTSFLLPFNIDHLWGFINEEGKEVIKPEYDEAALFSEGLAAVSKNGKFGYINKSGKVVIPFAYDDAESFKNNTAVITKKEKYGLINRSGDEVIAATYDNLSEPSEDICMAVSGEKSGYLTKSGKKLTDFIFDFAGDFKDGYAIASTDDKYGFLNHGGNYIIAPKYDKLILISNELLKAELNEKWGIINFAGEIILPFEYDAIGEFSNDRALVAKNKKCGYIDPGGRIIIPLAYTYNETLLASAQFINGFALVSQKSRPVLIDSLGTKIILPGYEETGIPSEGLIPVKKNRKWGYADMNGKLRIPCRFDYAKSFENGFAQVKLNKASGVIDSKGKTIVEPIYDEVIIKNNFFMVKNHEKSGLLSTAGSLLLQPVYDRIEFLSENIVSALQGEHLLYMNLKTGKIIRSDNK